MRVKTHLIQIGQREEYTIKWVKNIKDCRPKFNKENLPTFIIISNCGRLELTTFNLTEVEKAAKRFNQPKGKQALTKDTSYVYLKEDRGETLIGYVKHYHIRDFAPMFDEIEDN